jgi:glucoamylase
VYTLDGWTTKQTAQSKVVGYPGSFVDIATPALESGVTGKLEFTLHWPESAATHDHWLGYNVEVALTAPGGNVGDRPAS